MRVIHGVVRDGRIVLDDGVQLPEGMEVQVMLVAPEMPPTGEASEADREEVFLHRLFAEGKISRLPTGEPGPPGLDRAPVKIDGPPLSESVIKERR
jgi:hypothetical protein